MVTVTRLLLGLLLMAASIVIDVGGNLPTSTELLVVPPLFLVGLVLTVKSTPRSRGVLTRLRGRLDDRRHPGVAAPIRVSADVPRMEPLVPADGRPALEDPDTRAALRNYTRGAEILFFTGVAMAVFAVAAQVAIHGSDTRLLAIGQPTAGRIVWGGQGHYAQNWVEVVYRVQGNRYDRFLNGPSPIDLPQGSRVTVLYDPANPRHFRTARYANDSNLEWELGLFWPKILAGLLLIGGGVSLSRRRRYRRWLAASPWSTWTARQGTNTAFRSGGQFIELTVPSEEGQGQVVLLRIMAVSNATLTSLRVAGHSLLFCPGPGRKGVIWGRGLSRPFGVELPVTRRQFARWKRSVDKGSKSEERRRGSSQVLPPGPEAR